MLKRHPPLLCAAALLTLVVACGSNGPSTNLKSVMFRTMPLAPVATVTIQRQNGAGIANAQARFDTKQLFDGWLKVGQSTTATANANGVAALAMPSGSYPLRIDPRVSQNTALVGRLNDTFAISADTNRTYQTSQQTWNVSAPVAFSALNVVIYQVDGNGKAMVGTHQSPLDPVVLSATVPNGANTTSVVFTTELFKGSYRAVVTATPVSGSISPFETAPFSVAGGGATEPQTVTMISGGNVVTFQFKDSSGAATPDNEIGRLFVYDADSLIPIGSAKSTTGAATVATGAVASVVAVVTTPDGGTAAASAETASATHNKTVTRYVVAGHAKPPGASQLALTNGNNSYGTLQAQFDVGSLGAYWVDFLASPVDANLTDALGAYSTKLFGGNWSLKATGLKGLPDSKAVTLTGLAADVATEDVQIDAGAVLVGNIQDQARNNLANVPVSVFDSTHTFVSGANTDASGNYSIALAAGTYDVIAGGGLTKAVAVGGTSTTLNLTRFQITGRLTDTSSGPLAGRIVFGGGSVTATPLGTYTLNAMQGINWFLFTPPSTSPAVGFALETNVLVNADTVKSLTQ